MSKLGKIIDKVKATKMSTDLNEIRKEIVILNETSLNDNVNQIDSFPTCKFILCIVSNFLACFLYYLDIFSDINVLIQYFREEKYLYCSLTLFFILVPWIFTIINNLAKGEKRVLHAILAVFLNPFYALIQ